MAKITKSGPGHSYEGGNVVVRGGGTTKRATMNAQEATLATRLARLKNARMTKSAMGGVGTSNQYLMNRMNPRMKTSVTLACQPSVDVLTNTPYARKIAGGKNKQWMCGLESVWKYKEDKYAVQNNEFRLFIEGAEVSHYVQGTINWTIESTGGMNICRFLLNNTQDAFILTPENLCAGVDKGGWRLSTGGKTTLGPSRGLWRNFAVDETAKYLMYVSKYNEVLKDSKHSKIDKDTGMWLYPLGPYRCIIHKHDPVRLFIRLPNTSGISKKVSKTHWKYGELWTAAFTGFVKDYSWDDDPVQGTRTLSVTCYDYRGLMNRMRVRVEGLPQQSTSGGILTGAKKILKSAIDSAKINKDLGPTNGWLKEAMECGKWWENYFNSNWKDEKLWPKWGFTNLSCVTYDSVWDDKNQKSGKVKIVAYRNPYKFMEADPFLIVQRLQKLWDKLIIYHMRVKQKCITDMVRDRETYAVQGTKQDINCAKKAIQDLHKFFSPFAVKWVQTFAYSMLYILRMNSLRRQKYIFKVGGNDENFSITFSKLEYVLANKKGARNQADAANRTEEIYYQVGSYTKQVDDYIAVWKKENSGEQLGPAGSGEFSGSKLPPLFLSQFIEQARLQTDYNDEVAKKKNYIDTLKRNNTAYSEDSQFVRQYTTAISEANKKLEASRSKTQIYIQLLQTEEAKINTVLNDPSKLAAAVSSKLKPSYAPQNLLSTGVRTAFTTDLVAYIKLPTADAKLNYLYQIQARLDKMKSQILNTKSKAETVNSSAELKELYTMYVFLSIMDIDRGPLKNHLWGGSKNKWNNSDKTTPRGFLFLNKYMQELYRDAEKKIAKASGRTRAGTARDSKTVIETTLQWIKKGNANATNIETTKRITDKYVDFNKQQAGIFADLVESNKNLAHPLMGKSFEQAIEFLTTGGNSYFIVGAAYDITKYTDGILKAWNRLAVFGVLQRPMTYNEVSAVGLGTRRNLDSPFCPLSGFVHFLRPAQGTGAASIIQTSAASASENLTQAPSYETRKSLIDKTCQALDYQFYVSPMGDLVFEVPNYNAFPIDFGSTFQQAYTVSKDWISSTISEENTDVPTAYRFTGLTYEKKVEESHNSASIRHKKQWAYIWPILARRVGVQQQDVTLSIPGVGDPALTSTKFSGYLADPQKQLEVYAIFYMQRQLGRMHTLMVKHPYRPYLLPNRPIWLVPRQRIGLPQSVSHTMSAPDGTCTTESQLIYTREMFRDGTFRFVGGGQRQPIDYVGFLSGTKSYKVKEGVGLSFGYGQRLGATGRFSRSAILNRLRESSAFSTSMGNTFGNHFKYQSVQTGKPPSPAPKIGGGVINGPAAGLQSTPQTTDKKQATTIPKTLSADDTSYQGIFRSPWQTGAAGSTSFNAWGYLRRFQKHYYTKQSSGYDNWHPGIDIFCGIGTMARAPVALDSIRATIYCGSGMGPPLPMTIPVSYNEKVFKHLGYSLRQNPTLAQNPISIFFDTSKPIIKKASNWTGSVWSNAWEKWKFYTKNGKGAGILLGKSHSSGIGLTAFGKVAPPYSKDAGDVLYAQFRWYHLNDLLELKKGVFLGSDYTGTVEKGKHIGPMNKRGGGGPHLHLGMYVKPLDKGRTQQQVNLFNKLRKTQEEFLQTQLVAMASGWKYNSKNIVDPNKLDGEATKYWQRYKRRIRGSKSKDTSKVTVREIVDFMKKQNKWKKINPKRDADYFKGLNMLQTNPALFFTCAELLDVNTGKGPMMSALKRSCSAGGSTQNARVASGSANYVPPPLPWCGAGMGRITAGGRAKVTQARQKAQSAVIADPSKKKQINKKLKSSMEKSSAVQAHLTKAQNLSKSKSGRVGATMALRRVAKEKRRLSTLGGMAAGNTGIIQSVPPRPEKKN